MSGAVTKESQGCKMQKLRAAPNGTQMLVRRMKHLTTNASFCGTFVAIIMHRCRHCVTRMQRPSLLRGQRH